ncbi:hypothetical protein D3C76_1621110 [compost metagenome]
MGFPPDLVFHLLSVGLLFGQPVPLVHELLLNQRIEALTLGTHWLVFLLLVRQSIGDH